MFNAVCMQNQLIIPEHPENEHMAVVCLWTDRKRLLSWWGDRKLPVPAVIGQLYSANRGIEPLLRNLLANPHITLLVVTGKNMSGTAEGLSDCWRQLEQLALVPQSSASAVCVLRDTYGIQDDVQAHANRLVNQVQLWFDDGGESLHTFLSTKAAACAMVPKYTDPILLPLPPKVHRLRAPGPCDGGIIRGKTVAETWLRLLDRIRRYGRQSETHYDQGQQEIYALTCIVEDEPVDAWINAQAGELPKQPAWLPVTVDGVRKYVDQLWSGELPTGLKYTYGHLMRHPVDQVEGVIQKMLKVKMGTMQEHYAVEAADQRSACISLFRPEHSWTESGTPCLNMLQFRVIDNEFHMSISIRSNDMFSGWPENVLGFRILQAKVLDAIKRRAHGIADVDQFWEGVRLGHTITISHSAHYYRDCFAWVEQILAEQFEKVCGRKANPADPYGNWIINLLASLSEQPLRADLLDSASGRVCRTFFGSTAAELTKTISPFVQSSGHAMYLGTELAKAELCGRMGIPYVQDEPILIVAARIQGRDL